MRRISSAIVFIFVLGALLATGFYGSSDRVVEAQASDDGQVTGGDRLMVVAPHPDDESLAAGGLIFRAVRRGARVQIVFMTCGDGNRRCAQEALGKSEPRPQDFQKLGVMRHLEALNSMMSIGVKRRDLLFLAYPDGGLDSMFNDEWGPEHPHLGATLVGSSPYRFAYTHESVYCGSSVVRDLKKAISDFRPTVIVYPGPDDSHRDHWATNAFVQYALCDLGLKPREYTYVLHRNGAWPKPLGYEPASPLAPPCPDVSISTAWQTLDLADSERVAKTMAVLGYRSQLRAGPRFLKTFIRRNELFACPRLIRLDGTCGSDSIRIKTVVSHRFDDTLEAAGNPGPAPDQDIKNISFLANDRKIWLKTETGAPLADGVVYNTSLIFFKKGNGGRRAVRRLDVTYQDGRAFVSGSMGSPVRVGQPVDCRMENGRLTLEMPSALVRDSDYAMLAAVTYQAGGSWRQPSDRIGWRRLSF